uniref:Uncharacterized protein n=1 Tax=Magallana gigas TaxID=29159 RepID=A0A8W8IEF3_MAGGI
MAHYKAPVTHENEERVKVYFASGPDSFADVVCEEKTPNIKELEPTMEPKTKEPNQVPQKPSSHPDLLGVLDNNSSRDLESPAKELPEKAVNQPHLYAWIQPHKI